MTVKKGKSDAATVLKQAETLFRRQGFGNTTMSEIGAKSHLLKGSVYHYFSSKEEIGINIINKVSEEFRKNVLSFAYDESMSRPARLYQMMSMTEKYLRDQKSCLMAHLGLETAFSNERFSNLIKSFFEEWTLAIAHVLEEKYGKKQALHIAKDTVAKIEGSVIFLSICDDSEPMERIIKEAINLLE